jgi:FtsZ-interacting cell division protein ZipA
MATSTVILIVVVAVVAVLIVAGLVWVLRTNRTEHRRFEAEVIRDNAAEQSRKVRQREALADETVAKALAAQAEAEAMAAHAAGLQHQAQARRADAASARDEVNQEFERAATIDPDSDTSDTARDDSETRDTPGGTPTGKQGRHRCPEPGDVVTPASITGRGDSSGQIGAAPDV